MTGPKRVTEKQLAANRRNALKSTGPRTPQGKAASRWNALKHGVLAKAVIPGPLADYESRQDFDALFRSLREELAPNSVLEEMLVERIATSYWRLARVIRAEAGAIAKRQDARIRDAAQTDWGEVLSALGAKRPLCTADRVSNLANAMSNKARLRALMVDHDPNWRKATDQEVSAGAHKLLAQLQQQLDREQARTRALEEAQRSIPQLAETAPLARYEATLERQFYRALDTLERIKRLRGGDFVPPPGTLPPPLKITIDNSSDGGS